MVEYLGREPNDRRPNPSRWYKFSHLKTAAANGRSGLVDVRKVLVAIGLAEAPPPPIYEGNPDTKVWVDLQTGLYYCPNAELYGTTPQGRFTTQKDAQLDQFEPANRRACE